MRSFLADALRIIDKGNSKSDSKSQLERGNFFRANLEGDDGECCNRSCGIMGSGHGSGIKSSERDTSTPALTVENANRKADIKSTCCSVLVFQHSTVQKSTEKEKQEADGRGDWLNPDENKTLDELEFRATSRQKLTAVQKKQLRQLEVRDKAQLNDKEQEKLKELEQLALSEGEGQQLKDLQQHAKDQENLAEFANVLQIIEDERQLDMLEELAKKMLHK
jgi:hypothetical protein